MVELECQDYGGIRVSKILCNYDIQDMLELGYLGYGGTRISRINWN